VAARASREEMCRASARAGGIGRARPLPAQTTDRPTAAAALAFTVDLVFARRQKKRFGIEILCVPI